MNRFRSRKKSHDAGDDAPRKSDDAPPMPSLRSMTFRRKKSPPEPKPEVDLASVLPPSDDFRTSLLMSSLSARFSMLRDQDDPNTLIGKANDDSVLFPKRASRLNLFGHEGLSDIAEVASLSGSIRPPFAYGRADSYASFDGYGTDDDVSQTGSVMSRAKPGQGNKFFGGRQKIYKIPLGGSASARDLSTDGEARRAMGRPVYDDDMPMSAFQALKEKEKEDRNNDAESRSDPYVGSGRQSREQDDRGESPTLSGYNHNRETTSSTNSGPSDTRTSTAATSVNSLYGGNHVNGSSSNAGSAKQSPTALDRTNTKNKRMYGQGLEQQLYDQQSSALHRLESIQRPRVQGGIPLNKAVFQSRSATNLHDRFQKTGPLYASNSFRAASPPPSASASGLGGFDLGLDQEQSSPISRDGDSAFGRAPPISPPISPRTDPSTFLASLEPNDLGKATASGVFNKPKQFNEQQYAQRQLQLQEGRESPVPMSESRNGSMTGSERGGRTRNGSFASIQSNYAAKSHQHTNDHVLSAVPEAAPSKGRPLAFDPHHAADRSFLAGISGSDSSRAGSETDRGPSPEPPVLNHEQFQSLAQAAKDASRPSKYIHDDQHPAFKQDRNEKLFTELSPSEPNSGRNSQKISNNSPDHVILVTDLAEPVEKVDSSTLGPVNSTGLGGLIKTHLRNESNTSSVYPPSPQPEMGTFADAHESTPSASQDDTHKSSWEEEKNSREKILSSQQEQMSLRAQQMREQALRLRMGAPKAQQVLGLKSADKQQQILGGEAPRRSDESSGTTWQEQVRSHHARGGSTETEKEREDFATELADRRRRVQDNLKSFVESDSRSSSPMPGSRDNGAAKLTGAKSLLKKASRGSLVGKGESPSKTMKMLGIGPNPSTSIGLRGQSQDTSPKEVEDYRARAATINGQSRGPMSPPSTQPNGMKAPAGSGPTFAERSIGAERRQRFQEQHRRPSPPSQPSGRNHSASDATSRAAPPASNFSKPRKDFWPQEPSNGRSSPHPGVPPMNPRVEMRAHEPPNGRSSPLPNGRSKSARPETRVREPPRGINLQQARKYSPPRNHANNQATYDPPTERSQSAMSGRIRSNSKSTGPGYFDLKGGLLPLQTTYQGNYPGPIGRSPRASPVAPGYTAHTTPPLYDTSPNTSTVSTPTMIPANSTSFPSTHRVPAARKRSVNKLEISEPSFMSCTSSVITVDLPPGASLANGMDEVRHADATAPPVPPFNPRRKQRALQTQNVFTAFGGLKSPLSPRNEGMQSDPNLAPAKAAFGEPVVEEEHSTFSADEGDARPKSRHRLRKSTSEAGGMAAKARQLAMAPRPAMPVKQEVDVGGSGWL